ncbi:MAG: AAC(3) family N-acetyltransferase [Bacteroidota bacterium]
MTRYLPDGLVRVALGLRKRYSRYTMSLARKSGGISRDQLIHDLRSIGIQTGDSLLVHASLSRIGYVEGGADTLVEALLHAIGDTGNLLMPSFPAPGRNKDYLDQQPVFDVLNTPSAMGIVSETFRKWPGVVRSLHPTDPVCAKGPQALWFTSGHFNEATPYTAASPFARLMQRRGKILMLGTSLNGACTCLHVVEDAIPFPFSVYLPTPYKAELIDELGQHHTMLTRVHDPAWSSKRDADLLLPLFKSAGIIRSGKIGRANSMLIDAEGMLNTMIQACEQKGITMYTPEGKR